MQGLEQLSAEIIGCRRCPRLVRWRQQVGNEKRAAFRDWEYWARPLPGFGDPKAELAVVGLAPAAHGGNRTGRVFTGDRSGDWVYRALHRAGYCNQPNSDHRGDGLILSGAYVTAAVRCVPPANRPTPDERDRCMPFLKRELQLLDRLRVVVALGGFALQALALAYRQRPRPRFAHGAETHLSAGLNVLCSYHPSQQNTFTGRLSQEMFDIVFSRAKRLARETGAS